MNAKTGKVIALAVKPDHYAAMQDAAAIEVAEDGIKGSAWATSVRRVTILFAEQWEDVQRELGAAPVRVVVAGEQDSRRNEAVRPDGRGAHGSSGCAQAGFAGRCVRIGGPAGADRRG